jgi:hypothetical protein
MFPAVTHLHVQTPAEEDRAFPYRPKAALLYTGSNSSAAQQLSEGLLPGPAVTASTLLSAQRYLDGFRADLGPGVAAVPGGWLWGCAELGGVRATVPSLCSGWQCAKVHVMLC